MVISDKQKHLLSNIVNELKNFLYYRYKATMQQPVVVKKKKSNSTAQILGAVSGFAVGFAGAMLFTTKTGKQTREWVAYQVNTGAKKAGHQFSTGSKAVKDVFNQTKKKKADIF